MGPETAGWDPMGASRSIVSNPGIGPNRRSRRGAPSGSKLRTLVLQPAEPGLVNENLFNGLRTYPSLEIPKQFAKPVAINQVDWWCAIPNRLPLRISRKAT